MNQIIIEKMKEKIKKDLILKTYLDAGINEYGLTEEEALDCMIEAWWEECFTLDTLTSRKKEKKAW